MGEHGDAIRMWYQLIRARERIQRLQAWLVIAATLIIAEAVIIAVVATRP